MELIVEEDGVELIFNDDGSVTCGGRFGTRVSIKRSVPEVESVEESMEEDETPF